MTIALLATGDEIIQGDVLNTNTQALAHGLHSENLSLGLQMSCSDNQVELLNSLEFLAQHHSIIIITGGLGPTSDDRTRFALAQFMHVALVEFPEAMEHIKTRLERYHLAVNEGNRQQAQFPPNTTLLPNPNGTAQGCYCEYQGKLLILLPGPPRECLPMFNDYVLPLLQKKEHTDKQILKWRLFGVAEGQIAQVLDDALSHLDCETGYRLEIPYVECKVKCNASLFKEVEAIINPLVSPYVIAPVEKKASALLLDTIIHKKKIISIQDDATGGALQTLIYKPESYPWIKFQEQATDFPHFHLEGLKNYWNQTETGGVTEVILHYQYAGKSHKEKHSIPFIGPLVIYFAAEWLSFRLTHFINELH